MKKIAFVLGLLSFSAAFASVDDKAGDSYPVQFCKVMHKQRPSIDVKLCSTTGTLVLGGDNSEEAVYQFHKVRLFKNSSKLFYCIISVGEAGILFEGCQDWDKVAH